MAAGDEARAVFALHGAIEHYEQAWQLLTKQSTDQLRQAKIVVSDLHHLYITLGEALELIGVWEQGRPLYQAMLDSLLQMVTWENETRGLAKAHWYQAMLDFATADFETATLPGERALAMARTSGQPDLVVLSLNALISVMRHKGAWEEYERLATEVYACYVALEDRAMEADALCMLADAQVHRGRLQRGITHARSALTISQDIRNAWGQVNALYGLTSGFLDSGAYTEALDLSLQAVVSARTLNTRSERTNVLLLRALIQLGGVYRAMQAGDVARAIDLEALMLTETLALPSYKAVVATALCADFVLVGEWADAQRYARQAAAVADGHGLVYAEIPHWCVTQALLHEGNATTARGHLIQLNTHNGDGQRDRVQYLRASAELAQWEGHQEQARSHLEEACVLAEAIGLAEERWQLQVSLGDLDQSRGEPVLANQAYAQAVSVLQELSEKIEDEAWRARFLSAPRVRRVWEHVAS